MKTWSFMNGSKKMVYKVSAYYMLLLISMPSLFADEQTNTEVIPTIDFLEFLGDWETEEGEWLDPMEFENEELGQLIETTNETKNDNEH